jgi:hypothetical protein
MPSIAATCCAPLPFSLRCMKHLLTEQIQLHAAIFAPLDELEPAHSPSTNGLACGMACPMPEMYWIILQPAAFN